MRKEIALPSLAVAGGVAGFFLRRWGLATAFEADTGLPVPGAPATLALLALSLALAGVLLFFCVRFRPPFPDGFGQAFRLIGAAQAALVTAAGLLLGAAGVLRLTALPNAVLQLRASSPHQVSTLQVLMSAAPQLLLSLLCLCSAVCVVLIAKHSYRGTGPAPRSGLPLVPAYTCGLWLITAYQARAGDPVMLDYLYGFLAIMAVLLALYFMAGFSFGRPRAGQTAFFCLLAVCLSFITLADVHDLSGTLMYLCSICYLTASAFALLHNGREPDSGSEYGTPPSAEESPKED
ncbi:MAG: hypothetical protein GX585_04940 [Clostridiales bacterium]|nr:hypothetical protein [Clostridiales bacterium]